MWAEAWVNTLCGAAADIPIMFSKSTTAGEQTNSTWSKFAFNNFFTAGGKRTLHIDLYKLKMILNNTKVSYKYKIQQYFFSTNIFKNIAWSKPVKELLYVAYPVSFIKYTFELKQYKFHLNSRLRSFFVLFYSGRSDLCGHEMDGGLKEAVCCTSH